VLLLPVVCIVIQSAAEHVLPFLLSFNSRCSTVQAKANSAFHSCGVSKWVPASAGKAKAGMVHSISGCTWGVQVKLRSLENADIPERLRGVITTRCYIYTFTFTVNLCMWLLFPERFAAGNFCRTSLIRGVCQSICLLNKRPACVNVCWLSSSSVASVFYQFLIIIVKSAYRMMVRLSPMSNVKVEYSDHL